MQDFIARENIRRFEAKLRGACSEAERRTLEQLLDAERAHLKQICDKATKQAL